MTQLLATNLKASFCAEAPLAIFFKEKRKRKENEMKRVGGGDKNDFRMF